MSTRRHLADVSVKHKRKEIKNNTDIDDLMEIYGYFHDSCLRDIYISTSEYVDEKLTMHFSNIPFASLLFQRQFEPSNVLELRFEEIGQFNFYPFQEMENPVIYDALVMMKDGYIYWADCNNWEIGDNHSIWINGRKLFWRLRPELIGNIKRINNE